MTPACLTWEYAADALLLELHRLQNRVLCAMSIRNIERCTPVCGFHNSLRDYITKLFRTLGKTILIHVNQNVRGIGQGEAMHAMRQSRLRPISWLTAVSEWLNKFMHNLLHIPALTEILCILYKYFLQGNGPIRQVETCPDFFFTARVHTTKSRSLMDTKQRF
jgi:hypothetical protein